MQTTDTRIGTLNFENGFPSEATRKVFDEMDYQRAVQAYLWGYPAVSFEAIRIGSKRDLGADLNDFVIADNYADPKAVWLTANDTTIYSLTNVDLGKSGPLVVEIPPGAIVGILDDFWQRSLTDLGLPGPDGPNGGKFLLLPPGYRWCTFCQRLSLSMCLTNSRLKLLLGYHEFNGLKRYKFDLTS